MSTYTDNYVNPLEMDVWSLDPNDSKGMVREKGEFMLGLWNFLQMVRLTSSTTRQMWMWITDLQSMASGT